MQHDVGSHQVEVEYHTDIRCIRLLGLQSVQVHRRVASAEMASVMERSTCHSQRTPTDSGRPAIWSRQCEGKIVRISLR